MLIILYRERRMTEKSSRSSILLIFRIQGQMSNIRLLRRLKKKMKIKMND